MARQNHRAVRWLKAELPALVESGTINAETARALEQHYVGDASTGRGVGFAILASLGSLLVAAGVVLLVAHNWDEFSRATRTVFAFLPLIAAQIFAGFVLAKRSGSEPWRESAAIFNVMAIGIAISLVSQTYQIHGSFANFVLVWILLSLPLVYLFRTTLGAIAYLIGAVAWIFTQEWRSATVPLWFWLVWLGVAPYVVSLYRRDRESWEMTNVALPFAAAAAIGLGVTVEWASANVGVLAFAGFFTTIYLCGIELFPRPDSGRLHPLALLGGCAIGVMSIALTFRALWTVNTTGALNAFGKLGVAIQLLFPIFAIAFAASRLVRRRGIGFSILAVAFPVVVLIAWGIARLCPIDSGLTSGESRCAIAAAILLNLYTLALGVELLMRGMRANSLSRANFGLLLIAALAAVRFFDSDVSFVARGIGFIVIGAGFLLINIFLFRRKPASP